MEKQVKILCLMLNKTMSTSCFMQDETRSTKASRAVDVQKQQQKGKNKAGVQIEQKKLI